MPRVAKKTTVARPHPARASAKRIGGSIGAVIGGLAASEGGPGPALAAARLGRYVGRRVGSQFPKLFGKGDYFTGTRSVMNPRSAYAPSFASKTQDVLLTRSEYLCDIYSGTGTPSIFNLQSFFVNPGLNYTNGGAFSWLSGIAPNFQEYRFEQLMFEYRSSSGNSTGANTSLGSVILSMNYQSTDANYSNKAQMLDSQWSISGSPDKTIVFPVECSPQERQFAFHDVRSGPLLSSQNQDLFDMGNFQIATIGCQTASQQLGELHVVYTVRLSKFQTAAVSSLQRSAHYSIYVAALTAGPTNAQPLGTTTIPMVARANNQMALTFDYTSAASRVIFPPLISSGVFMLTWQWHGTSTASLLQPTRTYTNCAVENIIFSPVGAQAGSWGNAGATSAYLNFTQVIRITAPGAAVILNGGGTLPTTCYELDLMVNELNPLCNTQGI